MGGGWHGLGGGMGGGVTVKEEQRREVLDG